MKLRDIILIGSILLISVALFLVIQLNKEPGAGVIVRIDGNEVAKYSLSVNATYTLNGGTNILHIEDGKAWLTDATCPDKLCVRQGKISKEGETITCLPKKLTVTVYGVENEVELIG
jgi:hypothetical protein